MTAFDIQLVRRGILPKALKRRNTMITRRSFLLGAAGLLTYSLFDKYLNYFENHGEALIEYPKDYENTLYLNPSSNSFELGDFEDIDYPDPPTWAVWIENYMGEGVDINCPEQVEHLIHDYGVSPEDYEKPCNEDNWREHYAESYFFRDNTPNCFAYDYLNRLDLGNELLSRDRTGHGLSFCDAAGVHGDTKTVDPISPVSVSLLQKKLVELGEPTRIVTDYSDL
jgi:hypothetical protein